MRKPLTARQQEIYDFIVAEVIQRGIPPTIREIADKFGMNSSNGAREALNVLARKGYIHRRDRLSRGIELVDPVQASERVSGGSQPIPIIRGVPAEAPDVSQATIARHVVLDVSMLPSEGTIFAMVVPDDSMYHSGIRKQDMVIAVAGQPEADGDLVVVQIDGALAVRKYERSSQGIVLHSDAEDTVWSGNRGQKSVHILGRACGLVRHFGANRTGNGGA